MLSSTRFPDKCPEGCALSVRCWLTACGVIVLSCCVACAGCVR
jgi:hypothetical protein